jgi:hypothetical protein
MIDELREINAGNDSSHLVMRASYFGSTIKEKR